MVWDGDCGFCRFWITRWQSWTRDKIEYVSYQKLLPTGRFPELSVEECEKAVQYIDRDGNISRAAEAVFRSLTHTRLLGWLLWFYLTVPLVPPVTETFYRFVAGHRTIFSWSNRLLWGRNPEIPTYRQTTDLFVRGVGFVFLIAFFSLWTQIHGLVGDHGILPASGFMSSVGQYFDQNSVGISRYLKFPTLGWLAAGDTALSVYSLVGIVCSALVMVGLFPALTMFVCWVLYLSLTGLGQDFLSFQWDALLLETGFLAILVSPWSRTLRTATGKGRFIGIFLVRWLLFRLMLESGLVKLASGDPVWRDLTALGFHFETQPLPTWIGWFAHQLPAGLLKAGTFGMFVIELIVPLFIFAPRRLRLIAFAPLVGFQIVILLTGNYGFFNLLTIVLGFSLLDDRAIEAVKNFSIQSVARLRPKPETDRATSGGAESSARTGNDVFQDTGSLALSQPAASPEVLRSFMLRRACLTTYAVLAISIGGLQIVASTGGRVSAFGPVGWASNHLAPFHLINNYGLFAVMTRSRPELVIEGSADGINWQPYVFKYKPGPLDQRPAFLPFHMPRLDWQMWFAALNEGNAPRWIHQFCERLFERSPEVTALLQSNPFETDPPRYIRVLAYDYSFTRSSDNSGNWWQAAHKRYYLPILQYQRPDQR